MINKEQVLASLNFRNFYSQYIPSLKINGKAEAMGLCCFHDDKNPSLSVNIESGLYHCFSCGASGDAFTLYQKIKGVDFKTALKEIGEIQGITDAPKGKVVATFGYSDSAGKILYIKERIEPGRDGRKKEFIFKHLNDSNYWITGRGGDPVPYNLPLLIKSKYICVTEGEAKADFLTNQFKLTATCFDAGAQSPFKDNYLPYFAGKEKIIIMPDNDSPGRAYADKIASALRGHVKAIKIIELDGLPEAGDILNWVKVEGNDKGKLLKLIKNAPEWEAEPKPEQQESRAIDNIEVVNLDSVTAETVSWLWQGYIPLGKLTLIDGDPGLGKSLFSTDLASRLTTGQPMPDGTPSIKGGVILMSLEDGLADTIVPRLNVAGADKKKIIALQGVKDADGQYRFPTIEDVSAINQACKSVSAKLLVIDPLMGYLGHKVNSHKDQDIRRALSPLAKMANETGLSIIIIRHLVKSESNNAVYRGGGSIGIIGAARSALLVAKDPENENRRILAGIKSNLAPLPPSLSYTIENVGGIPKILWGGVTSHTADALLSIPSNPEERSALEEAKIFLEEVLVDGAVDSREIQRQAKQVGIAERTLHRAKNALNVTSKRDLFGKAGKWLWCLDCQDMPKVAKEKGGNLRGSLAILGDSEPPEGDILDLTNVDFVVSE